MLNINSIALVGELTDPPRSAVTKSGKAVTRMRIAVDREFDRRTADFFTVLAWQQLAELSGDWLAECAGLPISVKGRIQERELPATPGCGCRRTIWEVQASELGLPPRWLKQAYRERNARRGMRR